MYTKKIKEYLEDNNVNLIDIVKLLDDKRFIAYDMEDFDNYFYENSALEVAQIVERSLQTFSTYDDLFIFDTKDNILVSYTTDLEYNLALYENIDEIAIALNEMVLSINPMLLVIIKEVVK